MPITESTAIPHCQLRAMVGNNGTAKRQKPKVPIFSITPASTIDPATGACTWASGSQVCSGNIGTLIAKAKAKAANIQGAQVLIIIAMGERWSQVAPEARHAETSL